MKRVLQFIAIALLVVVGSSPLRPQSNPLVGTWKLNVAKSKFDPGPAPKSLTRTVVAQGDGVKYTFDGIGATVNPSPTASPSTLTAETIPSWVQYPAEQTPFPPPERSQHV